MKKLLSLALLASSFALTTPAFATTVEELQFDNAQQETDYRTLIKELRCPQCQNNNIADSHATIADDMRMKTLELLKQGKSKDDVVEYMVERYGNFVTYDPPLTPATVLLWALPILLILLGFYLVWSRNNNQKQAVENEQKFANSTLDQERLNQILNKE